MLKEYRKTATIKAEQFDGSEEMMDKYTIGKVKSGINASHPYVIFTLEGPLGLNVGDWIAIGVEGEHWAIADDIFKKTYEEVKYVSLPFDMYTKGVYTDNTHHEIGEAQY